MPAGTTVTFSGDFGNHPLAPSAARGTLTGNPITVDTSTGIDGVVHVPDARLLRVPTARFHGSDPTARCMSGVIWVRVSRAPRRLSRS